MFTAECVIDINGNDKNFVEVELNANNNANSDGMFNMIEVHYNITYENEIIYFNISAIFAL